MEPQHYMMLSGSAILARVDLDDYFWDRGGFIVDVDNLKRIPLGLANGASAFA
ncbi:hypothetical protein [Allorhodopirellula heiligendammensis]|nr:hypothetical protein [Allorhodopirellula heiligendammensis]